MEARERCYGGDGKDEKGVSSPFLHHLLSHLRGTLDVNYKLSFWSISHLTSFYSGLILGFLFAGDVKINSATAHPHQTPDGSVINVTVTYGRISSYKIIHIPPSSAQAGVNALEGGRVLCTIQPTSGIGYFHSFCLTDNYIIVTEQPLMVGIWKALAHKLAASSFEQWLRWDAKQLVRFHIIDRKDGHRVGIFTAEPFFVFHHINAFEKDEEIYLDACCYHDNSIIKQLYLHNLRSPAETGQKKFDVPDARRYKLPLGELRDGDEKEKPLLKAGDGMDYSLLCTGIELPRINYEEFNGKPYRFVLWILISTRLLNPIIRYYLL